MINTDKLKEVLTAYRDSFHKKKNGLNYTHWEDEKYKWIAVKHFQEHWDIDAPDFGAMFSQATAKHVNLLVSQSFFPRGMMQEFARVDPDAAREMFRYLFDESIPVVDRVNHFISESERLRVKYGKDKWKHHFQNLNSISTYLWMKYPDKYYIYKYSEVRETSKVLESDYVVKKGVKAEAYPGFISFYDEIARYVSGDEQTKKMFQEALTPDCYPDPKFHTLTVDIGFYISRYYSSKEPAPVKDSVPPGNPAYWPSQEEYPISITKEEWKKYIEEVEFPYNKGCMGMLKGMMELGGEASCKKLSSVYGGKPTRYVGCAVNIGKRAKKYFNLPACMDGEIERYFPIPFQGRMGNEDSPDYYSYRIRDELKAALNEIDLSSIDPFVTNGEAEDNTDGDEVNYWWLNANPKIWSYSDIAVDGEESYTLYNANGNKRRIFQNFLDAKPGDLVIGYESSPVKKVVALARISKEQDGKEIHFQKTESLANPIDYDRLKECPELKDMEVFTQAQGSLFRLTKEEYEIIMDLIREENPVQTGSEKIPKYTREDFLNEVFMDGTRYDSLVSLLLNKCNLILQGAPGVGKTFAARRLAYSIMGEQDDSRIEFVQFHQNYTYEDFMMGYRPTENGFELRYGIFYRFCMQAANHPDKKYFFIIDEINRGNLSKIFGELLMLIEKDYRSKKATLAYTGAQFSVPGNLYIIGMMNTADRSLAMIDYALRRRFSFYTMEPGFDTEGFKAYQSGLKSVKMNNLISVVMDLNREIARDKSLGQGFCIGHSYFCGHTAGEDESWLNQVVDYDIIPMLEEYWFDDPDQVKKWSAQLQGALNG